MKKSSRGLHRGLHIERRLKKKKKQENYYHESQDNGHFGKVGMGIRGFSITGNLFSNLFFTGFHVQ